MKVITVMPVQGGWSVDQVPGEHPLMFLTGGRAEQKARELAERCRLNGESARVAVHDRGGRLIGQIHFEADSAAI